MTSICVPVDSQLSSDETQKVASYAPFESMPSKKFLSMSGLESCGVLLFAIFTA